MKKRGKDLYRKVRRAKSWHLGERGSRHERRKRVAAARRAVGK